MIDIENQVFTLVADALRAAHPGVFVTGEYVKAPPSFPCVMIELRDNSTYRPTQDTSTLENHATILFEINAYSNKTSGKKSECKALMQTLDEVFLSIGFDRQACSPTPNYADATIYRMTARYIAIVSKEQVIYRRR